MIKLPSLQYLAAKAKTSLWRFPATIFVTLAGACLAIYMVEYEKDITNIFPYLNLMLCFALGIPLFFCVVILSDRRNFTPTHRVLLHLLGAGVLTLIYFSLPDSEQTQNTSQPYIRYAIYNICIHLVVAFIPYLREGQLNGFWQYNKSLFLRILTAILYSGFLYIGLVLAMVSLDLLFDVDINEKRYFQLFIFIISFFNTWFFLSGIPEDFESLDKDQEYPKGLKVFSQYILLPLLVLYLLILYGYGSKIILLWDWPRGIVSYMIACVAVLGILNLLLIYPYGKTEDNGWISKFSKAYYFILTPLVVILFIAIGMRLADYGITINRYIILLLGIWLTIICTYFIIGRKNIKFIPISLAVIIMLASFGPWGMFSVSERSQTNRLSAILEQNGLLKDGEIINQAKLKLDNSRHYPHVDEFTNKDILTDSLHNEVKSILDYMDDYHGFSAIRSWYEQDIDSLVNIVNDSNRWVNEAEMYMEAMGLEYQYIYKRNQTYYNYEVENHGYDEVRYIKGYDYLADINLYYYSRNDDYERNYRLDSTSFTLQYFYQNKHHLKMIVDKTDTINLPLHELITTLNNTYGHSTTNDIPLNKMTLHYADEQRKIKLDIKSIGFNNEKSDSTNLNTIVGDLLIKLNQ